MDNKNIYQQTTPPLPNYFSYGMYPAAMPSYIRPEAPAYMIPQTAVSAGLKGRPVTSFEEARVAQIDLDGSITFFPDVGNKKIYTKRINANGTAALQTYILDEKVAEVSHNEPVTREEFNELMNLVQAIAEKVGATSFDDDELYDDSEDMTLSILP